MFGVPSSLSLPALKSQAVVGFFLLRLLFCLPAGRTQGPVGWGWRDEGSSASFCMIASGGLACFYRRGWDQGTSLPVCPASGSH